MDILEQSKPMFEEYRLKEKDELKKYRHSKNNMLPDLTAMIGDKKAEENEKEPTGPKVNNQRLNTPTLKRLALINDGSQALKEEIHESYLRVKAAKHGMKLKDLIPNHGIEFYLPNKSNYVRPKDYQKMPSFKSTPTSLVRDRGEKDGSMFITALNHSQVVSRKSPEKDLKSVERSMQNGLHKPSLLGVSHPGRLKNKSVNYASGQIPGSTKNTSQRFRNAILQGTGQSLSRKDVNVPMSSPNQMKLGTSPEVPRRLNAVSYKFNRDQNAQQFDQRRKIRLVSLIDSKPINHYITLLTLKEFSKREQDMSGIAGSVQASTGLKEKDHQKNRDVAKILKEDLNEHYEEKIGRRYAAMKAEKEKMQSSINLDVHLKNEPDDKINETLSVANSVDSHTQSRTRRISKRVRGLGVTETTEPRGGNGKGKDISINEKIKGLLNPDFAKIIEDNVKRDIIEIYEFHNRQEEEQREQEQSSENKIENEEQAKRIAQLRRDQELAEFEEKGGLSRILNNLFNPKDESIELDSVYQLKQLCKSYYETKNKISKDLIETLDALLNERPQAISMKKKSFYNETDETQEEDPLLGKVHKNYYLDIECMRLNAEKERICHYREIARKSAVKYYKVLKEIMRQNLIHIMGSKASPEKAANSTIKGEKKIAQPNFYQQKETKINCIYYVTDYLKLVIENGNEFLQEHLYNLIDSLIPEELSDEVLETLRLIVHEFEFDKVKLEEWIGNSNGVSRKKRKILKILEQEQII